MERIVVFAALGWECRPVLRQLRAPQRERRGELTTWRAVLGPSEIWVVRTGVGMARAARAAQALESAGPFGVLCSTGCAGALSPELQPGDLTLATAMIGAPSGERFATDPAHRERAGRAAARAALRAVEGPVLCSPGVLATAAAKRAAAARHGAVAVEMEGAPLAAAAHRQGAAFLSVRAILDTADAELSEAGRFLDPQTGALKPLALAGYLLAHPGALSRLRGMQQMMSAAQTSLGRFFAAWLESR